tara:strand:+ start:49 stop:294 length:246 start_codon:yes stop_codon:yes gene_type:complete
MKITKTQLKQIIKEEFGSYADQIAAEDASKDEIIAEIVELMRERMQHNEVLGVLMTLQDDYPPGTGARSTAPMVPDDWEPA